MDEFKKYLRENKERMDFDEPAPFFWEEIRKGKNKKSFNVIRLLAAACLITFIISVVYYFSAKKDSNTQLSSLNKSFQHVDTPVTINNSISHIETSATPEMGIKTSRIKKRDQQLYVKSEKHVKGKKNDLESSVVESFSDMQKSFAIIINTQLSSIKNTPLYSEDANYFAVFKKEFQGLNSDEKGAKQEILQNGLHDVQIEKLINIYQQKIILLKHLQAEITKVNSHAPQEDEKDKKKPTYINL